MKELRDGRDRGSGRNYERADRAGGICEIRGEPGRRQNKIRRKEKRMHSTGFHMQRGGSISCSSIIGGGNDPLNANSSLQPTPQTVVSPEHDHVFRKETGRVCDTYDGGRDSRCYGSSAYALRWSPQQQHGHRPSDSTYVVLLALLPASRHDQSANATLALG